MQYLCMEVKHDLDKTANHLFKNESDMQDSERDIAEDDAIIKDTVNDFANCEDAGEQVSPALSQIVKDLVWKPITTEKCIKNWSCIPDQKI